MNFHNLYFNPYFKVYFLSLCPIPIYLYWEMWLSQAVVIVLMAMSINPLFITLAFPLSLITHISYSIKILSCNTFWFSRRIGGTRKPTYFMSLLNNQCKIVLIVPLGPIICNSQKFWLRCCSPGALILE